jgi:CheY-like chemotaxis protein
MDINEFKETVRRESKGLKKVPYSGYSAFTLALTLAVAVKKIFFEKSKTKFSNEPLLEKKRVVYYDGRMRVDAMEKFNATTVCSVVEFAASEQTLKKQEYILTLIVYLEKEYLAEFLSLLQYPYLDIDDDDELKDGCGTLVNLIAGQYKREMGLLGYDDFTMSHFESHINSVKEGIEVPKGAEDKYEITFEVQGVKHLVVELVTPPAVPKLQVSKKTTTKRILVIDDDPTLIKIITPLLKSQGFEVLVARDGQEGIERLIDNPHLIILDMKMPRMNGYEFILAMQQMEGAPKIPIIILTSRQGLENIVNVEIVKEYMIKPFKADALLQMIRRHL